MNIFKLLSTTATIYFILLFQVSAQNEIEITGKQFFPEKVVMALAHPYFNYSGDYAYLKGMRYETTFGLNEDELNGKYRTAVPQVSVMSNPMETEDAFAYEMKAAKLMGIDGFKFEFRPLNNDFYLRRFKKIITTYIKVAEEREIDFKFSLTIVMDRKASISADELLSKTKSSLTEIITLADLSDKWLRTGNDKIIIFTKGTQKVIDEGLSKNYSKNFVNNPDLMKRVAEQYAYLKDGMPDDLAFVYQSSALANNHLTNLILDYFPAVYSLKGIQSYKKGVEAIRKVCKNRGRAYIQCAFADQQGVQMFRRTDKAKLTEGSSIAKSTEVGDAFVKANNHKLTSTFRTMMGKSVEHNADMIFIDSWNYFDDGSHFAPELHHGYGLGLLLKYYKNVWKGNPNPIDEELVITSYKSNDILDLHKNKGVDVFLINKFHKREALDSIEVVTLLKTEAEVYCNNTYLGFAPAGLHAFYIKKEKGNVSIEVKRDRETIIAYDTPKEIALSSDKTDYLTYIFTNFDRSYASLFQNLILDVEMQKMRKRFLISGTQQLEWKLAAGECFYNNLEAMLSYGHDSGKYIATKEKNYKKYKLQIKNILSGMDYNIWLELEESAKNNQGILSLEDEGNGVLKGYNILEATQSLR
ncbi:glycoside hydrolase family 71/99 protein [Flammeovirga kamogawensis]|uniref:Uncharacterized protein n=1 Tax=Flammeovirga kamogawensis TaxID=373891 RepID=A0ABX8H364_9BACT|nr:hypothetical protein [Flammeovirga kamogawensis]MBB6463746.1 hypothetical protein [Flammeovirga kamogawensis]QWG09742.1 hypothetical protein KM029_24395 [Flammeovirga kamogawensis]TRX65255.1 hypothetical protein EO216_22285 [Flammeovirga kamogawensis]